VVRGSAFNVKDAGKEGQFHVEEDHVEEVTLRHDETGKTSKVSKKALAGMLHAEHAEAVGKVRARVTANLEQAKKTGTAKQQERAAALVSKYGGASEEPKQSTGALGSGVFRFDALPKDAARGAWNAASWTPGEKQQRAREEYERHLSDLAQQLDANTDDTTREHAVPLWEAYKGRYNRAWEKYIGAARGAVSWAVTGRGNFNVGRADKLNDREHAAAMEFMEVEKEGKKLLTDVRAIPKKLDPIGETRKQLEQEKAEHERKKAANKIIRAGGDALKMHAALVALGFAPKEALKVMSPDFAGRRGFPDHSLQNGLARIKDHERKLAELEARAKVRQEVAEGEGDGAGRREWPMKGGGGRIVDDLDANRLRLHFDDKPDAATIAKLKGSGWRWTPSEGAWSRIRTAMAFYSARNLGLVGEDEQW